MPPKPPPIQTPHFISTRRRLFSFSFHLLSPSWINFCTGSHATGATFAAAPIPTYFVCRAKEDWFIFYTYQTSVDSSPPAHIFSTRFYPLLYSCAGTSNLPIPSHWNGAHVLNKLISHNCCPRQNRWPYLLEGRCTIVIYNRWLPQLSWWRQRKAWRRQLQEGWQQHSVTPLNYSPHRKVVVWQEHLVEQCLNISSPNTSTNRDVIKH